MYSYTSTYGTMRHRAAIQEVCQLIAAARDAREIRELLGALLTPAELEAVAERWQIVCRLVDGQTQRQVRDALGVGIATVERGARELKYGNGAFQKFYERGKRVAA